MANKNFFVHNGLTVNSTSTYTVDSSGNIFSAGVSTLTNTTAATSTKSGALQVAGGLGIGGGIYSAGASTIDFGTQTQLSLGNITPISVKGNIYAASGGPISLLSFTDYSGQGNAGGAITWYGTGGNAVVQGQIAVYGANQPAYRDSILTISLGAHASTVSNEIVRMQQNGVVLINTTTQYSNENLAVNGAMYANGSIYSVLRADASTSGTTFIAYYNPATKEITTGTFNAGSVAFNGGSVTSATTFASTVTISSTASSVSSTTGALQVAGGVGIQGNLNVAGSVSIGGQTVVPSGIQEFTATQGQTTFTVTSGYTVGSTMVYANGILLGSGDYTASNGTTIVVGRSRNAGDTIRVQYGLASTGINQMQAFSIAMSIALG